MGSNFEEFPRESAVRDGQEQSWLHEPGCEYLVANPVEVPSLPSLPKSSGYVSRVVFGLKYTELEGTHDHDYDRLSVRTTTDCFQEPAELNCLRIGYLSAHDIAI